MNNIAISKIVKDNSDYKLQIDLILSTIPMLVVSFFLYGMRPILVVLVGIITAFFCDLLLYGISSQKRPFLDISSISSIIIMCCFFPATISYDIVIISTIFAIAIGKHVFGGQGSNIFNIAALGFCFSAIMFQNDVFNYPKPMTTLSFGGTAFNQLDKTPAFILKENGVPFVSLDDLFLGNYRGPLGTAFIIVIISVAMFLLLRKRITWHIPVAFLSTITILFFFFPRIITGRLDSVIYELFSQPMMFIALFILTDKTTTPVKDESKLFYGVSLGILSLFFEYVSPFPMATLFAVLIMNALSSYYDRVLTPYLLNIDYEHIVDKACLLYKNVCNSIKVFVKSFSSKNAKVNVYDNNKNINDKENSSANKNDMSDTEKIEVKKDNSKSKKTSNEDEKTK